MCFAWRLDLEDIYGATSGLCCSGGMRTSLKMYKYNRVLKNISEVSLGGSTKSYKFLESLVVK